MILRRLLPNGKPWRVVFDRQFSRFIQALESLETDSKEYSDGVLNDLYPETTRDLATWEAQFGLRDLGLSTEQRRQRLAAWWSARGGQSPAKIEETLRAAGFDVWVHDWWAPADATSPGSRAYVAPRNPLLHLRRDYLALRSMVDCGEALAAAGEGFAVAGNSLEPAGYPLVNKVYSTGRNYLVVAGEEGAEAGETWAEAGNYDALTDTPKTYVIPTDESAWHYFIYVGGEEFGSTANVDPRRKSEFEALCLRICPAHLWLGMMVEYTREVETWPLIHQPSTLTR